MILRTLKEGVIKVYALIKLFINNHKFMIFNSIDIKPISFL